MTRERSLFEKSVSGRRGYHLGEDFNLSDSSDHEALPSALLRQHPPRLPELSQLEVMRHFLNISQLNHAIDKEFYPLGSCTMKYNPKICDMAGQQPGFQELHPETPTLYAQGTLQSMFELQEYLKDITGFSAITLQPAAGAQGELVGMMMIKAYHQLRQEPERLEVLVPDSAHGTNPASAAMCGFKIVEIKSGANGLVDLDQIKKYVSHRTAAIMLTNPNTVGLFEKDILAITDRVHAAGGLCYYDGANLNAILGIAKVAKMGFDVMHMNTHKTFATPHGGGGPGSGPVLVNETLEPFLPIPLVVKDPHTHRYELDFNRPHTIGKVKLFFGNAEVHLRAKAYIDCYGADGLKAVSQLAVLNANYLKALLKDDYHIAYDNHCMHEFIMTSKHQHAHDDRINTMALAKRLMDFGYHPPTVYFPLIVPECMMLEPTETESKQTLDRFAEAMKQIAREAEHEPDLIVNAPHTTPIKRINETLANRHPVLNYFKGGGAATGSTLEKAGHTRS
jgi:glycine dehydrogenase subunit 2